MFYAPVPSVDQCLLKFRSNFGKCFSSLKQRAENADNLIKLKQNYENRLGELARHKKTIFEVSKKIKLFDKFLEENSESLDEQQVSEIEEKLNEFKNQILRKEINWDDVDVEKVGIFASVYFSSFQIVPLDTSTSF